ncbi:MAG: hypothetical protein LBK83_08310 [Treponema sp.]|jgi:hypothetical protein|nr:hypothetical protein [Treponema sp.]
MNKKTFRQKKSSMIVLAALLCIAALSVGSCNLPGGPDFGTGTLTLYLPGTTAQGTSVQNKAVVSRSILSDTFTGTLRYRLAFTGPGETQTMEAGGGGTTVSLDAGQWTIEAAAYDPGNPSVTVGSGSAVITVIAGQNTSVRIPMKVDPAYEGTLREIYIHTEAELRRVGTDFAIDGSFITHFYLENDIVLTQPWNPIGDDTAPFKALFDGQGHSITVNSFSGPVIGGFPKLGFFCAVESTTIKNVTIRYNLGAPVDIRGVGDSHDDTGGVAGYAINTRFENIQVTGNFSVLSDATSALSIGGIVGQASEVTITGCRVSGTIGGTSANYLTIGGIAGMIYNTSASGGDISGSSFTGTITGDSPSGICEAGGIAGYMLDVEITECFAEGRIEATAGEPRVGGIAGTINGSSDSINKSYASGIIESIAATGSYSDAGGIAGRITGTGAIENCYAWADVSTSSTYGETAGGIAGTSGGTISKCYTAGTVRSKGHDPYTVVGGIAGDGGGTITACMALVSELDGGPSASSSRTVNAVSASTYGTLNGNYSRNDIAVTRQTNGTAPGLNARDGQEENRTNFTTQTIYEPDLYTTAAWNFAAGTGDWKFISGYDYPVLRWQNSAPTLPPTPPTPPAA